MRLLDNIEDDIDAANRDMVREQLNKATDIILWTSVGDCMTAPAFEIPIENAIQEIISNVK